MADTDRDALDTSHFHSFLSDYARPGLGYVERVALVKEMKAYIREHFTPREAIREAEDAALERAASVADKAIGDSRREIAAAIRALKSK